MGWDMEKAIHLLDQNSATLILTNAVGAGSISNCLQLHVIKDTPAKLIKSEGCFGLKLLHVSDMCVKISCEFIKTGLSRNSCDFNICIFTFHALSSGTDHWYPMY